MRSDLEQHSIAYLQQLREQRADAERKKPSWVLIVVALVVLFLLPQLLPLLVVGGVLYGAAGKKKTGDSQKVRPKRETRKQREEDTVFRVTSVPPKTEYREEDGVVWLSEEKRLEQLKTLKDAGIIEQEEYQERKKRIQSGQ